MGKRIFSMPLNTGLTAEELNQVFVPFVKEYREFLYDIYFALFIPPFENDMMGIGHMHSDAHHEEVFRFMLWCQERFGVRVSATFNNFAVPPTEENLDRFISHFRPYYNDGLRSITIPHAHWARTGRLKAEFPELFLKNTVVRRVYGAAEYALAVESGFDLVNVDCSVIRDRDTLEELKAAYDHFHVPISLLANEICRGRCPLKDEHYYLNCVSEKGGAYFSQSISAVSCHRWKQELPHYRLLVEDLPPI